MGYKQLHARARMTVPQELARQTSLNDLLYPMDAVFTGCPRLVEQARIELVVAQQVVLLHKRLVPPNHEVDGWSREVAEELHQVLEDDQAIRYVLPKEP